MLCLSRHEGEWVTIGADIRIQVIRISGGKVTLGILAPRGVPVHRLEVYESILRQKKWEGESETTP
jgi:carbon storage regulator